jgi:hypothetical protein
MREGGVQEGPVAGEGEKKGKAQDQGRSGELELARFECSRAGAAAQTILIAQLCIYIRASSLGCSAQTRGGRA